jgi:hypothetical protein
MKAKSNEARADAKSYQKTVRWEFSLNAKSGEADFASYCKGDREKGQEGAPWGLQKTLPLALGLELSGFRL